jgi:hypothetical protein
VGTRRKEESGMGWSHLSGVPVGDSRSVPFKVIDLGWEADFQQELIDQVMPTAFKIPLVLIDLSS